MIGNESPQAFIDNSEFIDLKSGRKNLLINGNFAIWQRGTSFLGVLSPSVNYYTDRWYTATFATPNYDINKITGLVHKDAIRLTANAADAYVVAQRVEDKSRIENRSVTLNMQVLVSAGATDCQLRVFAGTGGDGVFTKPFTPTGSLQTVTFTVPDTGVGTVEDYFTFDVKATLAVGEVIEVHEAQAEFGSEATDFEYRPIAEELSMCERYFQSYKRTNLGVLTGTRFDSGRSTFALPLPTTLRAAPSVSLSGGTGLWSIRDGVGVRTDATINSAYLSSNGIDILLNVSPLAPDGNGAHAAFLADTNDVLSIDAEL